MAVTAANIPAVFLPGEGRGACDPDSLGGKARGLLRLAACGAEVPPWIAVRAGVLDDLLAGISCAEAFALRERVLRLDVPAALKAEVLRALRAAGLGEGLLAVRSSAAMEDGASASYAGQFETVLGVPAAGGEALWAAIRQVWASAFNPRALAYAGRQDGARMAVVLQQMVPAEVSGVAFGADPVTGERETVVVSAVYGLGEGLVSGSLDADTYRVAAGGAVRREIRRKEVALRVAPDGSVREESVPEALHDVPALRDEEILRIDRAVRVLGAALGVPQDVEWALGPGRGGERRLWMLQTRPVTALPSPSACPGERRLWDNSNIVESYAGVTTPLTFSFARAVYEDVYRQFCRVMGVSEALLEAHRPVFAHMLGLVRGRVYYNLLNWYRALALLPGYSFNRAFMERMMGVRQRLEEPPATPYAVSRTRDLLRLVRMGAILLREHHRLPREIARFHSRVDAVLAPLSREDLRARSMDELALLYHSLERDLLAQWRAPLVNDFFAMIWFGLLGRMVEEWLPDAPPALVNDLLCGDGGMISAEPARQAMLLAGEVTRSPELRALFEREADDRVLLGRLRDDPAHASFLAAFQAYLERFGDRCLNELKLETVPLGEDPTFLIRTVRAYAAQGVVAPEAAAERQHTIRREAEARALAGLRGVRRALFRKVLAQARRRVRDRENLRFERTRAFGLARRLFLAIGGHLARAGALADGRDVLYLTREEVFACLEGTGVTAGLGALAALRRAEFQAFEAAPAPPDRFETFGPPGVEGEWLGVEARRSAAPGEPSTLNSQPSTLRGTGCCPGVVRAPARVVRDPLAAGSLEGCILVAERTDPGWTLLFPQVKGLLVQRGSLLSHSAIVAREMGLPCVVGIAGLIETVRDGEAVEMDGATGIVSLTER